MKWVEDILPNNEQWGQFSKGLLSFRDSISNSIELGMHKSHFCERRSKALIVLWNWIVDPRLKKLGENKVDEWRRWFDTRLDDAIEAANNQEHPEIERKSIQCQILLLSIDSDSIHRFA